MKRCRRQTNAKHLVGGESRSRAKPDRLPATGNVLLYLNKKMAVRKRMFFSDRHFYFKNEKSNYLFPGITTVFQWFGSSSEPYWRPFNSCWSSFATGPKPSPNTVFLPFKSVIDDIGLIPAAVPVTKHSTAFFWTSFTETGRSSTL